MQWETVIGLEVHVQLATQSKLFSGSRNQFGDSPNSNTCAVDLGFPGTLPVVNQEAVRMAAKLGLALNAEVAKISHFDRKNYFYPDLPKGYQVTQAERPIFAGGIVPFDIDGQEFKIHLHHAHLEEDAGKSIHGITPGFSGIDLNRAGTPLLEIVTEPDFRNAQQASAFLKKIHTLVQYLEISDGNMAEGSLRCDANVSVRPVGQEKLGTRTEIKNLNSFRFIEQAIEYEVARHIHVLESGGSLVQETRLYDPDRNETRSMRSKEDANDYRYFPEPDLLPIIVEDSLLQQLKETMPELDDAKKKRYQEQLQLSDYDASQLTVDVAIARYFEAVLEVTGNEHAKAAANWVQTELLGSLKKREFKLTTQSDAAPVKPVQLANLILQIQSNVISNKIAKTIFEDLMENPRTEANAVELIIEEKGLKQNSNTDELAGFVDEIIAANPNQVQAYLNAPEEKRQKMTGFFIGQLMKKTQGKANPQVLNQLLLEKLNSL